MEHHYKCPDILEIQVYYDLVNAFVSLIESNIVIFLSSSKIYLYTDECSFKLEYIFEDNPKIIFNLRYWEDLEPPLSVTVDFSERKEFEYYLKVLIILGKCFYLIFI